MGDRGGKRELVAVREDGYGLKGKALEEHPLVIHLPSGMGGARTLCGLSGDNDQEVTLPRGARVTCPGCMNTWKEARRWSVSIFTTELN